MRILSYLIFVVLMTAIIIGSALVVMFLYLPFVAAKALWLTLAGRARLRVLGQTAHEGSTGRP